MKREPLTDSRQPRSAGQSVEGAHRLVGLHLHGALRKSALGAALAAASVGLVVLATACDQPRAGVSGSDLAGGVAPVVLIERAPVLETNAIRAGVDDQVVSGTPTPPALRGPVDDLAQGRSIETQSATPVAANDELVAEVRAQLSNRSGRRSDLESSDYLVEQGPDVVAVSDKLADARLTTAELAALSATTAEERAGLSARTAVQATPKPVVKALAPKPALAKVVVRNATPTPKPVVRKVVKTATPAPKPSTTTVSNLGQRVVTIAMRYLGYRYTAGGISPSTGFDCSGFTYYVYGQAGRPISRSLAGQYGTGRAISRSALQPGICSSSRTPTRRGCRTRQSTSAADASSTRRARALE